MKKRYDGREFLQHKVSDMMTGLTVIRIESIDKDLDLMVSADKRGISIGDLLVSSRENLKDLEKECPKDFDLEEFARLVVDAWKVHMQMAPKLNRSHLDVDL